jgi:Starch-binding associating with outer membrane
MTNKTLLRVGSAVALALTAFGCNNDKLTSLNQNPNSPEDVPPGPLFTDAARVGVARWYGGQDLRTYSWAVQQLSEIQYTDEDRYVRMHAADTEGAFNGAYSAELKDFTQIITKGVAAKQPGVYAPAQALRIWGFSYITDSWGDVPYFSALKGDSLGSTLTPPYDKQQDIYTDFFAVLDKASKDLVGASNALGSADPIYAGNVTKWQKFINSLRARLAMRVVNVDAALANTQLTAAINAPGGLILTNADNANFPWPGDGVYNNPWSVSLGARDDWRMSNRLINLMNSMSDPRVPIYAQPSVTPPNPYAGSPNGINNTRAVGYFNTTSRPGTVFYAGKTTYGTVFGGTGQKLATFVLGAAEVNFILAEAAERSMGGLTPGQAAAYYNTGITQSLAQWSAVAASAQQISATATAAYLAQPNVVYQGGVAGQTQIAQQKWIALFTDGGTAWAEWRRTCVPATVVAGIDATQTTVPRRLEYATLENTVNAVQVAAAVTNQGTDNLQTRVWWDKSPAAAPTYPGASCGVQNGT